MGSSIAKQNTKISIIDVSNVKKYRRIAGNINDVRLSVLSEIEQLKINPICICNNIWTLNDPDNQNKCPDIQIIERIGSSSQDAEVYKIKINNIEVAAKIIPVTSDKELIQYQNELRIANICSNSVKNNEISSFPIVYLKGICNNTIIQNDSKFFNETQNYGKLNFIKDNIKDSIKDKRKRLFFNKIIQTTPDMNELLNIVNKDFKVNLKYPDIFPITSFVLFSELMWGDFKSFLYKYKDMLEENQIIDFIKQIFISIDFMHNKLNIIHGDLHLGNILMYKNKNEWFTALHDFGGSQEITIWTDKIRGMDYDSFVKNLINEIQLLNIKLPTHVEKLINDVIIELNKREDTENLLEKRMLYLFNNL